VRPRAGLFLRGMLGMELAWRLAGAGGWPGFFEECAFGVVVERDDEDEEQGREQRYSSTSLGAATSGSCAHTSLSSMKYQQTIEGGCWVTVVDRGACGE